MLGQALNLLVEPMTTKANNSQIIENTKSKLPTQIQFEDYAAKHKAMYLNMGEIRAKIPARKPIPLFSFG